MDYRQIKTVEKKIEYCLQNFPETRNSDKTLIIKVWELFHSEVVIETTAGKAILLKDLYEIPSQDDAKRIRAKFNHLGKYLPTEERVARKRCMNIDEWRIAMGYPTEASVGTGSPNYTPPSEQKEPVQKPLI